MLRQHQRNKHTNTDFTPKMLTIGCDDDGDGDDYDDEEKDDDDI